MRRIRSFAIAVLLASACAKGNVTPNEPSEDWVHYDEDEDDHRNDERGCGIADPSPKLPMCNRGATPSTPCAQTPDRCRATATRIVRGNHPRAYRIVFVPVWYDDDFEDYRKQTARMAARLQLDPSTVVGRKPEMFDFYRVEGPLSIEPGACLDTYPGAGGRHIETNETVVAALARSAVPDVDVAIAVVNGLSGRAHASLPSSRKPGPIVLRAHDDTWVVDHELGHAIAGLGDEYGALLCDESPRETVTAGGADALQTYPNLSLHADGREWSALVQGAVPGGEGDPGGCVYHPTSSCRMLDVDQPFCAVCNAAIDRVLAERERSSPP